MKTCNILETGNNNIKLTLNSQPMLFTDLLKKYVDYHFAINDFSPDTRENYNSRIRNVEEFLIKIKESDLLADNVTVALMEDFNIWMRPRTSITHSSRNVELCKRALKWAKGRGIVSHNPLADYVAKRDKTKEVVCLEENELEKMINLETKSKRWEIVRDLYVFQSLSGLSWGDLRKYKIVKDEVGIWMYYRRAKTEIEGWIPLEVYQDSSKSKFINERGSVLKALHEKYNGRFPKMCLLTYNKAIREIAESLGMEKHLSSHTARKTFATIMFDNGFSLGGVKEMMAHKYESTTQNHYLKRSRKRLEMEVRMMA